MCGTCLSVSTGPRGSSIVGRRQSEDGSHRSETCTRSTTCGVSESVSLLSSSSLHGPVSADSVQESEGSR